MLTETITEKYEVFCDSDGKAIECVRIITRTVFKDKVQIATGEELYAMTLEELKEEMQRWL